MTTPPSQIQDGPPQPRSRTLPITLLPFAPPLTLAADGKRDLMPMMLWLGILIFIVIASGLVIMWYRRSLLAKENPDAAEQGLMSSLRAMRDRGEISAEEFDAMRKSMVRKAASRHREGATPEPRQRPARIDRPGDAAPPAGPARDQSR